MTKLFLALMAVLVLAACGDVPNASDSISNERSDASTQKILAMKQARDVHSYARPEEARVTHLNWSASVNMDTRIIDATATYDIQVAADSGRIYFDIENLSIRMVEVDGIPVEWMISEPKRFLGSALEIPISADSKQVTIAYQTAPDAGALFWIEGEKPFMFSQSQAILARTWIPCQDSPGVRYTYEATVQVPSDLMALMSASNPQEKNETGFYSFTMDQPIPSYLMALAVGDIAFQSVGPRTGVYAQPDLIEASAYEFAEMEDMLVAAEALYGEYAWERYDLLVLPPAFPFGGMENPRLTFATPTIIAGDRSLVALVAHELAHSWSGNLVTNATWDDFWLNEGFTVYFEQRIMEAVYGREESEMLALLTKQELIADEAAIRAEHPADTKLKLDLKGRNPDDGLTAIPYNKGYFFLRLVEESVGRVKFDAFLKEYFTSHAFQVMDTERFLAYMDENLFTGEHANAVDVDAWVYSEGIPSTIPNPDSDRIAQVDATVSAWVAGSVPTPELPWNEWGYQERYRFISNLPKEVSVEQMAALDTQFQIIETGNNEVLFAWLKQSVLTDYQVAYPRMETFLITVGRRKFLTPLYEAMVETGKSDMARRIYEKARPNYHSVSRGTMDELLGYTES